MFSPVFPKNRVINSPSSIFNLWKYFRVSVEWDSYSCPPYTSGIFVPVFLTPVGYILLSSSHQWKNHSLSLIPVRIIYKKGPLTTQQKVPKIFCFSSSLFTYCHCLNTCKMLMFASVLIWYKVNLYYFTNYCVLYWLILIPKRGSLDPNLKRGTFDQSKYVCKYVFVLFQLFKNWN